MINILLSEQFSGVKQEFLTDAEVHEIPLTIPDGATTIDFSFQITGGVSIELVDPDGVSSLILYQNTSSLSQVDNNSFIRANMPVKVGAGNDYVLRAYTTKTTTITPKRFVKFFGITFYEPLYETTDDFNTLNVIEVYLSEPFAPVIDEVWFNILGSGDNGGGTPVDPDPTSKNMIRGNISKLGLPFKANVVAVSLGLTPEVLGSSESDEITGDYEVDIYPHTGDVLLYVAPDYGVDFVPSFPMAEGQIVHPTVPNKRVYVALNDGALGSTEPAWIDQGTINSGTVTLQAVPLYRPLMNGFVKPTIEPI